MCNGGGVAVGDGDACGDVDGFVVAELKYIEVWDFYN